MTAEQIRIIAEAMATKASIVNFTRDDEEWTGNIRKHPIYSELKGMELTLKLLGIEFDYEFNSDVTKTTALIVNGERFEIRG